MLQIAGNFLSSTGHFTAVAEPENDGIKKESLFYQYSKAEEYKRNALELRPTAWTSTAQTIFLIPASIYGLDLSEASLVTGPLGAGESYSGRLATVMSEDEISSLPMIRLAPLASGLVRRYLDTRDLGAFSALVHLMDAMDLDAPWCQESLKGYPEDTIRFIESTIRGKPLRNSSLCMEGSRLRVRDEEEMRQARSIRGRD